MEKIAKNVIVPIRHPEEAVRAFGIPLPLFAIFRTPRA